jgi:peroxiredoxin
MKKIIGLILAVVLLLIFVKAGVADELAEIGKSAPDFTLTDLAGRSWKLSELKGRVVFLNFWASWCPPCRSEVPSIEKLKKHFNPRDLQVVTVSLDSSPPRLQKFLSEEKVTFPVLIGGDEVSRLYKVRGIPTTFIINKRGVIVARETGARDWMAPAEIASFKKLILEK